MSIYDEMQPVVREILGSADFKQGVTRLVQITPGTGPIDDPGPSVETSVPVDGVVRGVKWRYVNLGLASGSDMQITFAVVPGIEPKISDFVEVDGLRYKVVRVIAVPAAGTPVAYTLIINR